MKRCPFCGSENIYFSPKRKLNVCEDCDKTFEDEKKIRPKKVFLSYGHDENALLVDIIFEKLKERGHEPWIDYAKIKGGRDWRSEISKGISESSGFLAFISDYSTRVPGVCLDEISIGVGNWNCRIQSILLEKDVNVPNSISNIQWLDFSDWRKMRNAGNQQVWDKWLQDNMEQLYAIIEDEHNDVVAGNISFLEKKLNPLTGALKLRLILREELINRGWLVSLVEQWIDTSHDQNIFLLYGGPGTGKSVLAAYLCNFSDACAATYFCEWNRVETVDPRRFLHSIIFQLACNIEDFQTAIVGFFRDNNPEIMTVDELAEQTLLILNRMIDGERSSRLVIIDAIDEIGSEEKRIIRFIKKFMQQSPRWLKYLVTSRPEETIQEYFQGFYSYEIQMDSSEVQDDVKRYMQKSIQDKEAAEELSNYANGSFLMAKGLSELYLSNEGKQNFITDKKSFPGGVSDVYFENFERLFCDSEEYTTGYKLLFEVLLSLKEQITSQELALILGIPLLKLRSRIRKISSYVIVLEKDDVEYLQVFHKSFSEWLQSRGAGRFRIEPEEGNKCICHYILDHYMQPDQQTCYMMRYALDHISGRIWEDIPCEEQVNLLRELLLMSDRFGSLDMERRYLEIWESMFGKTKDYYCHALDYYKKVSGKTLIDTAEKALLCVDSVTDETEKFQYIAQISFAYFYAGFSAKAFSLMKNEYAAHSEDFWKNEHNAEKYWHVIAVTAHDLDKNKEVIMAAQNDAKASERSHRHYAHYIALVNLFDGYMAAGKLAKADQIAERVAACCAERYYIHVDDIYKICYANLLQTEGRIMEALLYYEEGLKLARDIHIWDYIYGSIRRELAIAKFGDPSALSALRNFEKSAVEAGYPYLVSMANCFYVLASHILGKPYDLKRIMRIETGGFSGHMLQAYACAMIDGIQPYDYNLITSLTDECEGVKGFPDIMRQFYDKFNERMLPRESKKLHAWLNEYVTPVLQYQDAFTRRNEEGLSRGPVLGATNCVQCQARCCYDGVYISEQEEKAITDFVNQNPVEFADLKRPFIVNGDWPGMESERKTEKQEYAGYRDDFPKHLTKTRCVFATEEGICRLQRLATDRQLHPWKVKPKACWAFPIPGTFDGQIMAPLSEADPDPDYIDENYPGYATFMPCAKLADDGMPWYKKYKHEVEYFRYLMREND